jgi:predicted nucleotide-binding protein
MPKIVLIDDDYATELLVESLSHRGHDARRIRSASAALQSIDEVATADLIILDIIMERPTTDTASAISGDTTTGMMLMKAFRERNPNVSVLVYSACNDKDVIDAITRTPHTTFLSKWATSSRADFLNKVEHIVGGPARNRVRTFIVHGHDTAEKLALKNYIQNTLGFAEPIILHEHASLGRTIIEKFEDYAAGVDFVFVLLTPDDKMAAADATNDDKRRARQNVIFELGYFLGTLGRLSGRVLLLYKGPLELPSDLAGIVYIDISKGVDAAGETIRKELRYDA